MPISFVFVFFSACVLQSSYSVPEFDLKIEYSEAYDKQMVADKMNVAFVNKIKLNETAHINSIMPDEIEVHASNPKAERNNKHPLEINYDTSGKYLTDKNSHLQLASFNQFKNLQPDILKKNLHAFTMTKTNSFYSTPAFEFPKHNRGILNNDIDTKFQGSLVNDDLRMFEANYDNVEHENSHSVTQKRHDNNYHLGNTKNWNNLAPGHRIKRFQHGISNDDREYISMLSHPKVVDILKKQTDLIDKLEEYLRTVKITKLRSDFENLIDSMEHRNITNTTEKQERITAKTEPTTRMSTVITLVDQNEVRKALRNNPFIQRLLKMASKKKQEYLEQARKYYSK